MDKMIVVVFDSERQAYDATRVLKDLHAEGSITVYAEAVIAKDSTGKVSVKQGADEGPIGTAVGLLTGMLVGLPFGPAGVAAGAAAGTYAGALYDLTDVGVGSAFIDDAAARLTPGKAAVVAEIQEEWITPLDSRMEALGGTVLRRTWSDVVDAQIARDVAAIDADIDAMEAEYEQATEAERAKLQARIADAKAELTKIQQRASARIEAADREAEEKMAALDKQFATADAERQRKLEQRKVEVQEDHKRRSAKLEEARELSKQAARLTREAVTP